MAKPKPPWPRLPRPAWRCSYENKPAEVIQKDLGTDYLSRINAALTTVRGVNRTDVKALGDRRGDAGCPAQASERCGWVAPWPRALERCLPPWPKNLTRR